MLMRKAHCKGLSDTAIELLGSDVHADGRSTPGVAGSLGRLARGLHPLPVSPVWFPSLLYLRAPKLCTPRPSRQTDRIAEGAKQQQQLAAMGLMDTLYNVRGSDGCSEA